MRCPHCQGPDTQVLETRDADDAVRRRRICRSCEQRFTTYERAEELPVIVLKRDGREEEFDREKLLRGLIRAAAKRPVTVPDLEEVVDTIATEARNSGGTLKVERVGELALTLLRELDPVAYIRFASVYRNFSDVQEFEAELERLETTPAPKKKTKKVVSGRTRMINNSAKNLEEKTSSTL